MSILVFKLVMTPVFIGGVSLAGRRWGPIVGGLLIGLPLTSGPVSVFLALQYGPAFAARAAVGTLAGLASVCVFCLAYHLAARRFAWKGSAALSLGAFLGGTALCQQVDWRLPSAVLLVLGAIVGVARLIPPRRLPQALLPAPAWDLPARMAVATAFVLGLTAAARGLGPQLSGLISPAPVFAVVIAAFTHHHQGKEAASQVLRGVVTGSMAFFTFLVVAALALERLPLALAYALAAAGSLGASALTFLAVGRKSALYAAVFGG